MRYNVLEQFFTLLVIIGAIENFRKDWAISILTFTWYGWYFIKNSSKLFYKELLQFSFRIGEICCSSNDTKL